MITTNQTDHPEQEIITGMETKPAFDKIEKLFVTSVVRRTTWHQNAGSRTKSHMTIGTLTNSNGHKANNNNNTINKMIIEPMLRKSKRRYTTTWKKVGALSKLTNFVDSVNLSQGHNNQTKIMEWD